jgi:hypothetical protein
LNRIGKFHQLIAAHKYHGEHNDNNQTHHDLLDITLQGRPPRSSQRMIPSLYNDPLLQPD